MRLHYLGIFSGILILYGLINYYIGIRGWQALGSQISFLDKRVYWVVYWLLALSYILSRLLARFLPELAKHLMNLAGAYWIAAMLYFLLAIVFIDILRFVDIWTGFIPAALKNRPVYTGMTILAIVAVILVFGTWNARHPRITHYDINIPKKAGQIKSLHIAAVSDIHIGEMINNKNSIVRMVDMINRLKPDIVLLPGDTIDEDIKPFINQGLDEDFKKINAKYGVFASLGNHEYFSGQIDKIIELLQGAGIKVLADSSVKIADGFYLIGRHDPTFERMQGMPRKSLDELMEDMNRDLPVILMDHQPVGLSDAEAHGVNLQISGHTHRGQLFPNQLITQRFFEIDWGYLKKGSLNVVVSDGFGTWGPPVRIGNVPEIVDIMVRFGN